MLEETVGRETCSVLYFMKRKELLRESVLLVTSIRVEILSSFCFTEPKKNFKNE